MDEMEAGGNPFKIFPWSVFDANSYVLAEGREALIVDAVDSDEMISWLSARSVENITVFLTHEHFDHISGLARLRSGFACRVIASAECSKRMQSPRTNLSLIADTVISMHNHTEIAGAVAAFSASPADETFDRERIFAWRGHKILCRNMGGHSPGSACYILDDAILFSGDELLPNPVITRLPGGSGEKYWMEDMPWFEGVRSGVSIVLPGHGQPGNMEDMIKANVPERRRAVSHRKRRS